MYNSDVAEAIAPLPTHAIFLPQGSLVFASEKVCAMFGSYEGEYSFRGGLLTCAIGVEPGLCLCGRHRIVNFDDEDECLKCGIPHHGRYVLDASAIPPWTQGQP